MTERPRLRWGKDAGAAKTVFTMTSLFQEKSIPLVPYTKGEEALNTLTHAAGLVLCGFIASRCVAPAFASGQALRIVCSLLYLLGTAATFTVSALYHGVKPGPAKRRLRLLDHCAIFFAVAGTAAGCVPAVYDTVGIVPSVVMVAAAWTGVITGLALTLKDFEGARGRQMAAYILTGLICAVSGGGAYKHLPKAAFHALLGGSALLLAGAVLCGVGKRVRYIHPLFHVFVDAGLTVYFLGISAYCY